MLYLVGDKTIKLLEENIGINLHYFGFGIVFLKVIPKHKQKEKLLSWTASKLKSYRFQKLSTK